MSENSKIEWTDHTFNPWIGCARVSPGCDHCYAAVSTPARTMNIAWGASVPRHRTTPETWAAPIRWNKRHAEFFAAHGRRQRVFCASLADVFDNDVDPAWRRDLFDLVEMTPHLDWLLLTKRIGNVRRLLPVHDWCVGRDNVWLGATVVNQEEADRDIPKLLAVPARVRFLSMEPLLGPVEFSNVSKRADAISQLGKKALSGIDWVIAGGESGRDARPMHLSWARSLRDQCAAAGVPFLFKQWGEWAPGSNWPDDVPIPSGERAYFDGQELDDNDAVWRVGKKAAGRLLDGRAHDEFPRSAR